MPTFYQFIWKNRGDQASAWYERFVEQLAMPSVAASAAVIHNDVMSNEIPSIVDAALNLSDPERASLAYRLLQSLKPPKVLSDGDSQFESELDRRVDDFEAGRSSASDWDQAASRLQAKLKDRESL